eukprot:4921365-Pyramimonas_sp.AAC.1
MSAHRSNASWRPKRAPRNAPIPRQRSHASSGTPLARFVAPEGAPQKASVATFICIPSAHCVTPHTFRGNIGSSTECPHANIRMRPRLSFRHTPHTLRGNARISTEGHNDNIRMRLRLSFRYTPHTLRGATRTSSEGHAGNVLMRPRRSYRRGHANPTDVFLAQVR